MTTVVVFLLLPSMSHGRNHEDSPLPAGLGAFGGLSAPLEAGPRPDTREPPKEEFLPDPPLRIPPEDLCEEKPREDEPPLEKPLEPPPPLRPPLRPPLPIMLTFPFRPKTSRAPYKRPLMLSRSLPASSYNTAVHRHPRRADRACVLSPLRPVHPSQRP